MPHKYCKSCGHKNEYAGSVPKFCSNCGAPLGASQIKPPARNSIAQTGNFESLAEDETDVNFLPNISRLQVEVSPFEKKSFKVEELFPIDKNGETKG